MFPFYERRLYQSDKEAGKRLRIGSFSVVASQECRQWNWQMTDGLNPLNAAMVILLPAVAALKERTNGWTSLSLSLSLSTRRCAESGVKCRVHIRCAARCVALRRKTEICFY